MKILKPGDFTLNSSNVLDSAYPVWDSATTYNTGDIVYVTENHGEYQSLTDSNTNKYPLDNPADWQWLGTTNRWRMFDQYLNTATTNNGTIEIEVSAYDVGGIYVGNIVGTNLTIEIKDNATGEVIESESVSLIPDPLDWEDYFFGSWIDNYKRNYFYERKTLTRDISIHLVLDNGSDDAQIGIFAIGQMDNIGATLYDIGASALDFSKVVTDTNTGATYLQQGNYVKTLQADIFAWTSGIDSVYRKLVEIRGLPVVFIGEEYETLNVFGFIKKFETVIKGPKETLITLDIQGLI
ncbi:hypothetical protein [Nitrosophilus kaiyonis]|uniref:hypothetical protein n=1 Tax=Nitrosophilus kaiyonis TaxID=2930200 RepID=UPI0024929911|nr:hypothetical protein [Nitrosophilus kaiyonis]